MRTRSKTYDVVSWNSIELVEAGGLDIVGNETKLRDKRVASAGVNQFGAFDSAAEVDSSFALTTCRR